MEYIQPWTFSSPNNQLIALSRGIAIIAKTTRSLCWTHCLQSKRMLLPYHLSFPWNVTEQESFSGSLSRCHLRPVSLTRESRSESESQEGRTQARPGRVLARNQLQRLPKLKGAKHWRRLLKELLLSKAVFISGHKSYFLKELVKTNEQISSSCQAEKHF